jgi:hypothetical protein
MKFGVNSHGQRPDLAATAGFDFVRLTVRWRDVEPHPGKWDWSIPDRMIGEAKAHGLGVLAVLSTVPTWAGGGEYGTRLTQSAWPLWAEFVYRATRRYAVEVQNFEAWNEPDLPSVHVGVGRDLPLWKRPYAEDLIPFLDVDLRGRLLAPVTSSRPRWRAALVYRGMRPRRAVSHHANGGSRSLDSVFRAIRLHRAMIDELGGRAEGRWCTECGFASYATRGDDALRLLGTLDAAGYEGAALYQLVGPDGLYLNGKPWNEPLIDRLRDRNWPPCSARDIQPRTVDRLKARLYYIQGKAREVLRWS